MNGVGLLEGDEMIPLLADWLTECSLPFGFGLRRDDKCAIVVHRYQLETIADIAIYIHEISLYAVCSYQLHRLWQTLDCGVSGISASSSHLTSQPASFSIGVYFNFDFFVQMFVLIFVGSDGSCVLFGRVNDCLRVLIIMKNERFSIGFMKCFFCRDSFIFILFDFIFYKATYVMKNVNQLHDFK